MRFYIPVFYSPIEGEGEGMGMGMVNKRLVLNLHVMVLVSIVHSNNHSNEWMD